MPPPSATAKRRYPWLRDVITFGAVFGALGAVYLLPADTSLAEVKRSGRLTVCMPDLYPPLVTGDAERPGFDVELLGQVAQGMDLTLAVVPNPAMSRDFNPGTWRVTRAQCTLLAGGVVLTDRVLSYLDATAPYLDTGWAVVSTRPLDTLEGAKVGFFAGLNGLDRLALSRQLRAAGIRPTIVNSAADLEKRLADGSLDAGISEALTVRTIAGAHDWPAEWIGSGGERYPVGIGLWKGDLTLKRALSAEIEKLRASGALDALLEKYQIADIEGAIGVAP